MPKASNENYLQPISSFIDPEFPQGTLLQNKVDYLRLLLDQRERFEKYLDDLIERAIKQIHEENKHSAHFYEKTITRLQSELYLMDNTKLLPEKDTKLPEEVYKFDKPPPVIYEGIEKEGEAHRIKQDSLGAS